MFVRTRTLFPKFVHHTDTEGIISRYTIQFVYHTDTEGIVGVSLGPDLHVSDAAVHFLSVGMLLLALFGTISQLVHRHERRGLRLLHKPGTLASAAALIGQTRSAELLDGLQRPDEMNEALQDRRFRIDPNRLKIVTEDERRARVRESGAIPLGRLRESSSANST
jgi:hypothetical protein